MNWITGSERCLLDLVAHLDRTRFRPIVWCNAPALVAAAADLGAEALRSPEWSAHDGLLPDRALVRAARQVVGEHGIRLVHANDADPLKALLPAARSARIPIVAHLHLRLSEEERRWAFLHQASLAVGVSEAAVRGLRDDGFPSERTAVIYNGVDAERLGRGDARELRAALGIPERAVVFGVIGSLIERKRVDVALSAFARLRERRDDVALIVCGDGPLEAELRALADTARERASVHFLGRRGDVGAVLRDAVDVLVAAAREESFGLNVVEAGLFGVPAIASDIEAHREIVAQDVDGLLVPVGDAETLAAAMQALAADAALRARLGAAARARAEGSFLVARYVTEFEQAYTRLLARPAAAYGWRAAASWPATYTRWIAEAVGRRLAGGVRGGSRASGDARAG